ncbi:MAG: ATP-binding protein [Alphaproteobacteria bacterium]|nr:ATP-binding protein [Alphaproteobacteria bacterium]
MLKTAQTSLRPSDTPKRVHFSLRRQITAALFCAAVAVAFASGLVVKRLETNYLMENLNRQSEQTFHILTAAALEAVISEDQPLLKTIVQQVAGQEADLLSVNILNEDGRTLARWTNQHAPAEIEPVTFAKKVVFEGETFGEIAIEWNFFYVREEIERHALIIQFSVGLGILLLTGIIIALVDFLAIKPINGISGRLSDFARDNLDADYEVSRFASSELHNLNDSVDRLDQALRLKVQREDELRKTLEKLQHAQKMETVGNLTGGIAHDFNNLLGILIGNLDLMKELVPGDEELTELVDEALEAGLRGRELNRRLLAFARRQSLNPEVIDVNESLTGMTKLLRRTLGEAIEIVLRCNASVWPVLVDPSQLETAILNLGINARDAMPNGGTLTLETRRVHIDDSVAQQDVEMEPGDYVLLAVTDSGTGMTPDVLKRVFDPFFTTKEVGQGTGLGLSMVHGFIKQSGGYVTIYSEPGHGTSVRLYLPRDMSEPVEADDIEVDQTEPRGDGQTVLVVEDNEGMRRVARKQLTELGYQVVEADNAAAAIELLDAGARVDLVFSDVVMPGELDGIGLATLLADTYPELPVLLTSGFTARPSNDERWKSFSDIDTELLMKPYRRQELACAVNRQLKAA